MAYAFPTETLVELVLNGNAKTTTQKMIVAGRHVSVVWLQITAAGRRAIA
jgi:hypothetical protein